MLRVPFDFAVTSKLKSTSIVVLSLVFIYYQYHHTVNANANHCATLLRWYHLVHHRQLPNTAPFLLLDVNAVRQVKGACVSVLPAHVFADSAVCTIHSNE